MKDIKSIIDDDRIRYHEDLSHADSDELVYAWDFFKEMAVWTDNEIKKRHGDKR